MKHRVLLFVIVAVNCTLVQSQPDWSTIKAGFQPEYDSSLFEKPFLQTQAVGGWEDGVFISRDGLNMYCFYAPVDMISYAGDIGSSSPCEFPVIGPYWRGPMYGVDTSTIIEPCDHWMHSDVVHASRSSVSEPFSSWKPTDINSPLYYEGAPQTISKANDLLDLFVYTRATTGLSDIYIMRDVPNNPTDNGRIIDPENVKSPSGAEDNPHIEKIDESTYVLFFDDTYDGNHNMEIYFSISTDAGKTWTRAEQVTSLSSAAEEVMPHLWYDGAEWWMYFATSSPVLTDGRLTIVRSKQINKGDWLNWEKPQVVIAPGSIKNGNGEVFGVGEPTLTSWGDISFSVIYGNANQSDTTDQFDSDPWYLPRKQPKVMAKTDLNGLINPITIFPNPAQEFVRIRSNYGRGLTVSLIDLKGNLVTTDRTFQGALTIDTNYLRSGLYFLEINPIGGERMIRKVFVR